MLEKTFWLSKVIYNASERSYDFLGANIVYSKGEVGSKVDVISVERANTVNDPAILVIVTQPGLYTELTAAGLKQLPSDEKDFLSSTALNTTKLRRMATNIKAFN